MYNIYNFLIILFLHMNFINTFILRQSRFRILVGEVVTLRREKRRLFVTC
jgi:hypothetical protein